MTVLQMTRANEAKVKAKRCWIKRLSVALALVGLAAIGRRFQALAQPGEGDWTTPVNLSHSGAASNPAIVAGPDGTLRVFWWDRFDGLTVTDGSVPTLASSEAWSEPAAAPIFLVETITTTVEAETPEGEPVVEEEQIFTPIEAMPRIVADAAGRAHAFWLGEPLEPEEAEQVDEETGARPLMHSLLAAGSTSWSWAGVVAGSAVSFDVAADAEGTLHLVYVRASHSQSSPAGLYYRRSNDGGATWGAPTAIYQSRYFRLLSEDAHLRLAVDGASGVYVTWDDPRLERVSFAHSADGGVTWQTTGPVGDPDGRPQRGQIIAVSDGEVLLVWEDARVGGTCKLYQAPASELLTDAGSGGQRVLEELTACLENARFLPLGEGQALMVASSGDTLTLAAWDGERWSEPKELGFQFMDPELGKQIHLRDLQAVLVQLSGGEEGGKVVETLVVVGTDQNGEVWVTASQVGALELVFAPPPPWPTPIHLSQEGAEAGWPAVALDAGEGLHVVWGQASPEARRGGASGDGPGTALFYARWDSSRERWSRAVEVVRGAPDEEMARQPALLADAQQEMLHLVWSGGKQGQIFYRRARISEARGSGGWSPSQPLPAPASVGSWPQIGMDTAGRLYVAYAVPVNEERGIYLTRSEDGGKTWSEPQAIFDAAAASWAMADHPALAVAPDGTLHVAWVHGALPGTWPPQGIYYARSADGGGSWTEPLEIAGPGYDWPRLALVGGQVHLLYAEAGSGDMWHRWSDVRSQASSGDHWSTAVRIWGWKGAGGPFGLAASGPPAGSGTTLHLVGTDTEGEALLYSTWDGSHWSAVETFRLGSELEMGLGVAVATLPQGGRLAMALRALEAGEAGEAEETMPAIFCAMRAIPTVEVPLAPTSASPSTSVVASSSTPEPTAVPSPTPDPSIGSGQALTSGPPTSGSSMNPLLLGGGLAAVIVVGVLATWGFRRGRG